MINIYPINSGHIVIEVSDTFRLEEAENLADRILKEVNRVRAVKEIFANE